MSGKRGTMATETPKESLEQLADRLERMATETIALAQIIRQKAEEIGEHERERRDKEE